MPRVEEQKRHNKPKNIGREERYDQSKEELVLEKIGNAEGMVFDLLLYRSHRNEKRCKDQIEHYNTPEVDHSHVELIRSLWSISKCQHEACQKRC